MSLKEKIRTRDKVKDTHQRKTDLSHIFGTLRTKLTAQQLRDELNDRLFR